MPLISVIDNENNKQNRNTKNKTKQTKTKNYKWGGSYIERLRAKWFCFAFKLGFLQLICNGSLRKPNLELALSNILNERELYESKHVAVECRCLKI